MTSTLLEEVVAGRAPAVAALTVDQVHRMLETGILRDGDPVVSLGDFACRVHATGKSATTRWAFIWKLRDGRVYSYEQFRDPALAAAFH